MTARNTFLVVTLTLLAGCAMPTPHLAVNDAAEDRELPTPAVNGTPANNLPPTTTRHAESDGGDSEGDPLEPGPSTNPEPVPAEAGNGSIPLAYESRTNWIENGQRTQGLTVAATNASIHLNISAGPSAAPHPYRFMGLNASQVQLHDNGTIDVIELHVETLQSAAPGPPNETYLDIWLNATLAPGKYRVKATMTSMMADSREVLAVTDFAVDLAIT